MVYERQTARDPDVRPMIMMRSGFVGSQRYGFIPWTGDVKRSWGGLKPQAELSLQMGLFGLAYTHSDLGGFTGNPQDIASKVWVLGLRNGFRIARPGIPTGLFTIIISSF